MLGAAFPIPAVPGLALTAEYRFMGLAGNRSNGYTLNTPVGTGTGTAKFTDDYNHAS